MKTPEPAPKWEDFSQEEKNQANKLLFSGELKSLLQDANKEYLYWDKFKYFQFPKNVDPRLAWVCLKFDRQANSRDLPLKNKHENDFCFWQPNKVQEDLHHIDSYLRGFISTNENVINQETQEAYLARSLMEEAISSGILEGAATTRQQAKAMLVSGKKPESHAEKMIHNNYVTIESLNLLKDQALSVELLHDVHRKITRDTLNNEAASGRFRTIEDGNITVISAQEETLHVPPPPEEIEKRMQDLVDFANSKKLDGSFIHPTVKAIILHFMIGYIHPYVDGNGRVARALFYWFMLKMGYWQVQYMPISRYFLKAQAQYARAYLYAEIDDSDLTYFIVYNLKAIRNSIEDFTQYISRKQSELSSLSQKLKDHPDLNNRQITLLKHSLMNPGYMYSIQKHKNYHGVTYQTARMDLLKLAEKSMADQRKLGRAFYFVVKEEIRRQLAD